MFFPHFVAPMHFVVDSDVIPSHDVSQGFVYYSGLATIFCMLLPDLGLALPKASISFTA